MQINDKILITGRYGFVGSSIEQTFKSHGFNNIIGLSSKELNLIDQNQVNTYFATHKPKYVIMAGAKVGGIMANIKEPAQFIYNNLMIQNNVIHAAYQHQVQKLLFLGSSCMYPRLSEQPMKEEYLLDGKLEPTNEGYAIAKLAGMKMCEMYNKEYGTDFITVIPCNIYGIRDHFGVDSSHVMAALISKIDAAKAASDNVIELWGTGSAKREFIFNEDLAEACYYIFNSNIQEVLNIGTGKDISIKDLAYLVSEVIGYKGTIQFDNIHPDGMPRKLLDVNKLHQLGWRHKIELLEGITKTYQWYKRYKI